MAVTEKKHDPKQDPTSSPAPAKAAPVLIELHAHSRYIWEGALYEKGAIYPCPAELADKFLRHKDDYGKRVFKKHVAKPVVVKKVEGVSVTPMPESDRHDMSLRDLASDSERSAIEAEIKARRDADDLEKQESEEQFEDAGDEEIAEA